VLKRARLPLVAAVAVVLLLLTGAAVSRIDLWPGNPFGSETRDRSATPLLRAVRDLSRYTAATGDFQVVVDLERDVRNVPSVLAGERTLFLAQGSVDSFVDFSELGDDAVAVAGDGSVTITLPRAALSRAQVDPAQSRVLSRQRGVLDRVGGVFSDDPTSERELYAVAADRIADAAREADLQRRAEDNTRAMLTGLLGSLGRDRVTVVFVDAPQP
jgi:hypothetical protein